MISEEQRPVLANGKRGMFCGWFQGWFQASYWSETRSFAHPVAVVEFEDGSCETFQACMIRFLDVEVKRDDD